jgi:iron-sulfur cluster repair protein YtfE (RIC family)
MEKVLPWIGVIGALAGAIVGGSIALINLRLQLREQRKRERNKLFLSKLEEIHKVLSKFRECYRGSIRERLLTAHGLEKIEEDASQVPIEKLKMLVGFYAPELAEHLRKVGDARKNYSGVLIKSIGVERLNDAAKKMRLVLYLS